MAYNNSTGGIVITNAVNRVCSELCFSENFYGIATSQIICFASGWLFNNTLRIYTESYFQTGLIKFFV